MGENRLGILIYENKIRINGIFCSRDSIFKYRGWISRINKSKLYGIRLYKLYYEKNT